MERIPVCTHTLPVPLPLLTSTRVLLHQDPNLGCPLTWRLLKSPVSRHGLLGVGLQPKNLGGHSSVHSGGDREVHLGSGLACLAKAPPNHHTAGQEQPEPSPRCQQPHRPLPVPSPLSQSPVTLFPVVGRLLGKLFIRRHSPKHGPHAVVIDSVLIIHINGIIAASLRVVIRVSVAYGPGQRRSGIGFPATGTPTLLCWSVLL